MKVFLSYRRADSQATAGRMAQFLDAIPAVAEVFLDVDGISPGENFERRIQQTLAQVSHVFVLGQQGAWLGVQGESLGPAIDIRPGYENFWMYIPHFIHSPFYVYAYAFGDCLVNSLYAVYEHASEGFAERYLAMLAAGGTKHYSELLKPFGLDAKDPRFWDGGLSVIAGMIDELEAMG